jgi:hypothetical protein
LIEKYDEEEVFYLPQLFSPRRESR